MGKGEALWLYVICDSHAGGKRGLLICALDFPPHSRRKSVTWTAHHYTTAHSLGCLWRAEGPHSIRDHLYENRYKSSRTLPFSKLPHPASFIHCSPFHLSQAPHHPLCPLTISALSLADFASLRTCFILISFPYHHSPLVIKKIHITQKEPLGQLSEVEDHRSQVSTRCKFQWCLCAFGHFCVSINLGQEARWRWWPAEMSDS